MDSKQSAESYERNRLLNASESVCASHNAPATDRQRSSAEPCVYRLLRRDAPQAGDGDSRALGVPERADTELGSATSERTSLLNGGQDQKRQGGQRGRALRCG